MTRTVHEQTRYFIKSLGRRAWVRGDWTTQDEAYREAAKLAVETAENVVISQRVTTTVVTTLVIVEPKL